MPRVVRLSILPAIGILFLIAAYVWSLREVNLRLFGTPAEGRLVGMVLQRADHADVLAALETQLVVSLANGDRVEATYADYTFRSAIYKPANGSQPRALSAADFDSQTSPAGLSPELRRVINELVRGDAAIARWALLREGRRPNDPLRVLRIEKIETVQGYFGVKNVPQVFGLRDGRLLLNEDGSRSSFAGTVRIRGLFDRTDPALAKANKGETLVEYSYERNGVSVTPAQRNFFLNAEPYVTQFRPVFAFEANGRAVARLSHIGRRGGPTLALVLFGPCRVYYDRERPEEAIVTAVAGPVAGEPLAWFSRFCEGLFGQWGSAALISLAGLLFLTTGLLFIYLAMRGDRFAAPQNSPVESAGQ